MQCYSDILPPTAASHSVALPFLHAKANNLVVAKTSLLQLFDLRSQSTEVRENGPARTTEDPADEIDFELHRVEDTTKLHLICEFALSGSVTALKRVKILGTRSGGEALLIAFKDAKLSLVEWDPEAFKLSTVSVHFYEGEALQSCPWSPELSTCRSHLTVDPSSRCAALKFGQRQLAILPFRQLVDDLVEDYDPDFDDPTDKLKIEQGKKFEVDATTPYSASFVLSLTLLDPALTHPVHLAFLFGFRDPTFGILYSSKSTSSSLLHERRDILTYTIVNLDIAQRASTSIISVTGLPNDLFEVCPLAEPIGGALLIGSNELMHVDQDGKVNALAVNEFAKMVSKFAMTDGSSLGLRLEHSTVHQISDSNNLLLILNSGDLAIISFEMEGRSVSSFEVHKVAADSGGSVLPLGVSCATSLSKSRVFLGSHEGDAVLLGWKSLQKQPQLTRKRSHTDMIGEEEDDEMDDIDLDDDDDIYGADEKATKGRAGTAQAGISPADYVFRVHDTLPNLAPAGPITLALPTSRVESESPVEQVEMIYPSGRSSAGGLASLSREIQPCVHTTYDIPKAKAIWGVRPMHDLAANVDFHEFVVALQSSHEGEDRSVLYQINSNGLDICEKDDFQAEATTIEVGTIAGGKKIVQVCRDQAIVYDAEFNLEQIIGIEDETTGVEIKFIGASFCDPYVCVLREDSSIAVWHQSDGGEIEQLDRGEGILSASWLSASVYKPPNDETPLLFGLNAEGALKIFQLPDLTNIAYSADGLAFLPPFLTADFMLKRSAGKEVLTEILVADLGDESAKSTYLMARTKNDDLVLYEPFKYPMGSPTSSFVTNLRWRKVPQPNLARYSDEMDADLGAIGRSSTLKRLDNVGGYSTVFQTGSSPSFILREASSAPRVIPLRGKSIKSLSRFHTADCDRGFAYVDEKGEVRVCQLPSNCRFGDTGWVTRKIGFGVETTHAEYYAPKHLLCTASTEKVMFKLPDDDYHHEWDNEKTEFLPTIDQGAIRMYYPKDWSLLDIHVLDPAEVVLSMKFIELEVSEQTHARQTLLCVGTAMVYGEDLATKGHIYVFEINDVVPEPDRPETGSKFKLIVKEEVRGSVTALASVGDEGFLLHVQGQKCMVRGLKEDKTLLPVAFMDVQTHTTVAKCLKGTGMVLVGDVMKGIWFVGYTQEPYRMTLFGKSRQRIEVVDAEFLPYDKHLYILVADADSNLQVLEYDNEHPQSLSGQRLVSKATFHTGHFPISLLTLPTTLSTKTQDLTDPEALPDAKSEDGETDEDPAPTPQTTLNQALLLTQTGAAALVTPIDEQTYRRLGALQTYLINQLDHACGLNPRGYRAVEGQTKGVIDGSILRRWSELGSWRRAEACAKLGVEEWVVRSDLEVLSGNGLGYL